MTIDNTLTIEEKERMGLDLLGKLPDNNSFKYYYGSWAFTSEEGNLVEGYLMRAGTPAAWKGLGELYERTAIATKNKGGSEFISSGGSCKSRDLLAYWAVRSYLKAGDEEKALETLNKFCEDEVVVPQSKIELIIQNFFGREPKREIRPNLSLIFTLVNQTKTVSLAKSRIESPSYHAFDLPDLTAFPKFCQELERIEKKYSNYFKYLK